MRWKIFYANGSTFSDQDGKPQDAPKRGVQIVHVEDGRCGRRVLKYGDYYVWSPTLGRWVEALDATAVIQRAHIEPWLVILFGEYLLEADFQRILIAAHEDDYIKPVSPSEPPHVAWRA